MKRMAFALSLFLFLGTGSFASAKTDISVSSSDISFSKENVFLGEKIRIFARINNVGDTDVLGVASFYDNGKKIGSDQPISIRANTYDDVFMDYAPGLGDHAFEIKLSGEQTDEVKENNQAKRENYFVDIDSDQDGTGDKEDTDDDNDGLTDEQEKATGTKPTLADTDGDQAKDGGDAFPEDATEWSDTDKDGLGDNKDIDDDNDGIFDYEEEFTYGTNPLSIDTDGDTIQDKQEVDAGTSAVKADTDDDGVTDQADGFPLDPTQFQASVLGSVTDELKKNPYLYGGLGAATILILFLLFGKRKRRR